MKSPIGKLCDCGNKATVVKQNTAVCARCDSIEHKLHTYTRIGVKHLRRIATNADIVYRVPGLRYNQI